MTKPWIHPQERRSRIYWLVQIVGGVLVMLLVPILLLRDPTQDHVLIAVAIVVVGAVGVAIGVKILRKIPKEYMSEPPSEDHTDAPG